ncbi:MAG: hypothetical protein K5839_02250 [Treponemataceae bacterium]|nr:hypothetical protein [Treponemataceae bacterium]
MKNESFEKSRPYTANDFDSVSCDYYNKFHNIRYHASKIEVRDGEIYFEIDGKEYTGQELYKNFDERYNTYDFGNEYHYLPAGVRESHDMQSKIDEKQKELNRVCPYCGSKDVISSEDPCDISFSLESNTPNGIYIKCMSCNFTLHTTSHSDPYEKYSIYSEFVDRWNSLCNK